MPRIAVLVLIGTLAAGCAPRYADLPMTPTQSMAEAEDALRRGEYATAVSGFSEYLATGEPTFRARAFYEMAQAQSTTRSASAPMPFASGTSPGNAATTATGSSCARASKRRSTS
jgi:hypothetical protein